MKLDDVTALPALSSPILRASSALLFVAASGWPVFAWLSGQRVTEDGLVIAVSGMIALGLVFVAAAVVANILEAREVGRLQALFREVRESNQEAQNLAARIIGSSERGERTWTLLGHRPRAIDLED